MRRLTTTFVIGLIQNLLLNAKLRFAKASDSSGVELCDTYLSRVDLLRLLVSARYSKIPSIQELTKPDLARRVRDQLIKDDRFGLAMEVSTKCQLDTGAVWSAWGMACLKSGDFPEARSKLKHCFQVSSQSKVLGSGGGSHLLQRIVDQIEKTPLSIAGETTRTSENWAEVVDGSTNMSSHRRSEECDLDYLRFRECEHYLKTYGTHSSSVAFYVRHCCFREACKFLLDNRCSAEVFVEQLWVPVLKSGQADQVVRCMKDFDPSMGAWQQHLTAACRLFSKKGLFSVLLVTQIYMNDFVRAGLTCIKFFVGFSGRSTTIADLHRRLHYLDQATAHFQAALDTKPRMSDRGWSMSRPRGQRGGFEDSGSSGSGRTWSTGPGLKPVNELELKNNLNTITLQKRVVMHLYHSAQAMSTLKQPLGGSGGGASGGGAGSPATPSTQPHPSSSGGSSQSQPPTLFSNAYIRGEVATQVLTNSHDLAEGFGIAREIITHYKLNSRQVYCETSRCLAMKQRYSEIRVLLQAFLKSHPPPLSRSAQSSVEALSDDIIMAAIKVLASQSREAKQVDKLVGMLNSDRSKINAMVQCGKLKGAYLIAVRAKLADEIKKISEIAFRAGQLQVRDICEKWLQTNAPSSAAATT